MNPNNKRNPWRGLTAELRGRLKARTVDPEQLSSGAAIKAYCGLVWPAMPPVSGWTAANTYRALLAEGHVPPPERVEVPVAAAPKEGYTGILFDDEDVVVQVRGASWRFTSEQWQEVCRLMGKAGQFFGRSG